MKEEPKTGVNDVNWVHTIYLFQCLNWVFATQERKKESQLGVGKN